MENKVIKIQIKAWLGRLIFEYESENNTIKETVLEAIKANADLRSADLSGADLRSTDLSDANLSDANLSDANLSDADLSDANLRGADLRGANLRGANLRGANLSDADLRGANLRGANLSDADLSDANLRGADLRGAKNKETAYLPIFCKWTPCIIGDKIRIGCKKKTIEEWDSFFASTETYETPRGSEDFKQIEAVYLAYKAYFQHLNKTRNDN